MIGLRFQDPLWLTALIPLVLLGWLMIRRQGRSAIVFSDIAVPLALPVTMALRIKRLLPWLGLAATALFVVALARPQHGREEFRIRTEGIAIEMCLDRSGSMQAMDFHLDGKRVDRLAAVKNVFRNFVQGDGEPAGRSDDQIGLIAFGGYAHDRCPPTLDHDTLIDILKTVDIAKPIYDAQDRIINRRLLQEEQATAIGDAVALAIDRLRGVEAKSKVIILLSDGEQTAGVVQPAEAAEAAKAHGIKIYTIGVGSTGRAPFPAVDPAGNTVLVQQIVQLDETTLKMMAETTGGHYFNAKDTDALQQVYAEIDQLEKTLTEGRLYTQYRELYQYVLFPALGLLVLQIVAVSTRFRSLP